MSGLWLCRHAILRVVKVLAEVRREMKVAEAVAAELSSWNRLLPPRWGDRALRGSEAEVGAWMTSLLRRELTIDSEEVVLARKLGRGARPCSLLGLKERLLYRGAVSLIEVVIGTPDRSQAAYHAFQEAPLNVDGCEYVLKADIASYYQYVDHERLVDEVVAQTGDDLAVSLAVEVLGQTSSRKFGLPQLSSVSDVLADAYIDPMRRVLVRRGYPVWCFADDFRVACRSYDEALAALEAADEAARELGLVLNELKSSTPRINRYRASLTAVRDRERELFAMLEVEELDDPDPGEYRDEGALDEHPEHDSLLDEVDFEDADLQPEPSNEDEGVSEAQLLAASKVVDLWVEEEEDDDTQRSERAQVTAKILGRALRVFTLGGDPAALDHVASMLVYEPSLTPTIARYMRECGRVARGPARDTLDDVCRSGIVSTWQAMWIAYVAGELPRRRGGKNLAHVAWLREQLRSPFAALRAEASLALARRRLTSADELLHIAAGLPGIHRPTVLLGLAALGEEAKAIGAADSELDRLRVRWGLERL
jgi:hypothetical protein